MKGINVRKLAAIVTGAALLGSAVAPMVSAATVQKSDVYNADGTPKVNIVVGSDAKISDGIWAGNHAAKIAEKAQTKKTVDVTGGSGTPGSASGNVDLSNLTVDVTVGGTVTYGAGSKTYNINLNSGSAAGDVEVLTAMDSSDSNALTSQLPHLVNKSITVKVNNGDQANQTNSLLVKEMIGVDVDAKFDSTNTSVKDLVAKVQSGKLSYKTNIGSSTSGIDLGSTSFTDDGDDNVKLIFFGEEYQLNTASIGSTGTKNLKLVKSSAKETYTEGQEIEGLVGDHKYNDKPVKVKFKQITAGSATATYKAAFELYDGEGNLIDTQTVSQGANLRDSFRASDASEALKSNLFVNTIAVAPTTNLGYVEVTKGTDTVLLYDQKEYPYDSTKTSGTKRYTTIITTASGDANSLYSVEIRNAAEQWTSPSTDGYELGPLYATDETQSLSGHKASTATFGQGWPDGILGKGYVTVEFTGFENKQNKTVIEFGKNVTGIATGTNGGLSFRADNDAVRTIPFYIKLSDTNAGNAFDFEGKSVWYSMRHSTSSTQSSPKTTANDYNILVKTGDYLNGRTWTITGGDANVNLVIQGIGVVGDSIGPPTDATVKSVYDLNNVTVDGITYKIQDANTGANATNTMVVSVDEVAEFRLNSDTGTLLYNTSGDAADASYGLMALSQNVPFDGNVSTGTTKTTLGLYTQDSTRPVRYAAKYNNATNKLFLVLDAQKFGEGASNVIKDSHKVAFYGTSLPADDGTYTEADALNVSFADDTNTGGQIQVSKGAVVYGHYVPKDTDFNTSSQNGGVYTSSNAYFVAEFVIDDAATSGSDYNAYIDTSSGGNIGPFGGSTTNLSGYSYDVRFRGSNSWNLQEGTDASYLKAGYSDSGAKAWLLDADAGEKFSLPQAAEKINVVLKGKGVTTTVSSGEPIKGLKVGAQGSSASGTKVTVTAVNGGSCKVDLNKGTPGACVADPDTYWAQAGVKNPIVYLDTDNPTGTNVVIGGHIVNKLASKLADRLNAPGQKVMEVDAASGNIYAAGYTAQDTVSAVKDLINAIDAFEAG